jgi:FdhD protein
MSTGNGEHTPGLARRGVLDVRSGRGSDRQDLLAEEVPLAIHLNGEPLAVMMVTPCDLEDFAYGFALTELGLTASALTGVHVQALLEGLHADIRADAAEHPPHQPEEPRWLPGRSGCGICGNRRLEDVVRQPDVVGQGSAIASSTLDAALHAVTEHQPLNAASGAVHAAAFVAPDGTVRRVREDVGRHNALDKLIGALQRAGIDGGGGFVVVTSRASYEMVAKAAAAGVPLLAAMSAPTALAVDLAQRCGMTLVGFARIGRHVVYSHPERLIAEGPALAQLAK